MLLADCIWIILFHGTKVCFNQKTYSHILCGFRCKYCVWISSGQRPVSVCSSFTINILWNCISVISGMWHWEADTRNWKKQENMTNYTGQTLFLNVILVYRTKRVLCSSQLKTFSILTNYFSNKNFKMCSTPVKMQNNLFFYIFFLCFDIRSKQVSGQTVLKLVLN